MSYTVVDLVQTILSALDSDEVNSISDTVESLQVAKILKRSYYDLITEIDMPEHESLFELTASGTTAKPTLMYIPENIKKINWVKYNNKETTDTYSKYKDVCFMELPAFQRMMTNLSGNTTNVGEMTVTNNSESFEFMYRTDKQPTYYTTLDDTILIFDSYDIAEDSTLQKSKTMCSGILYPTLVLSDATIIDLNEQQISLLTNRAIERAFVELKQTENIDARRETRRQRIISTKQKRKAERIPEVYRAPRYGKN